MRISTRRAKGGGIPPSSAGTSGTHSSTGGSSGGPSSTLLGAGALGWWSFHNLDYADRQWWRVMGDVEAGRAIRAWAGAGVLLLAMGLWRLFATPATPKVAGDHDPDFERVRAILETAEVCTPDAKLALLGDKRFLFSETGQSFLMFGVRGRSWIALGGPVGRSDEVAELLWRFRELADAHAARPGVYGFGPDLLPEMVEMGMRVQKVGEAAVVPLREFSLQGRKREVLRRNWRKARESGAEFEVLSPDQAARHIDELKAVSDQWLRTHAGGDKSFSMGGFEPRYVCEFPSAVVRVEGRIVAFAMTLVGHVRGGLGYVGIMAAVMMAALSGSAVADAAALSALLLPMMKRAGYDPALASSIFLTTVTDVMGFFTFLGLATLVLLR